MKIQIKRETDRRREDRWTDTDRLRQTCKETDIQAYKRTDKMPEKKKKTGTIERERGWGRQRERERERVVGGGGVSISSLGHAGGLTRHFENGSMEPRRVCFFFCLFVFVFVVTCFKYYKAGL